MAPQAYSCCEYGFTTTCEMEQMSDTSRRVACYARRREVKVRNTEESVQIGAQPFPILSLTARTRTRPFAGPTTLFSPIWRSMVRGERTSLDFCPRSTAVMHTAFNCISPRENNHHLQTVYSLFIRLVFTTLTLFFRPQRKHQTFP